MLLITIIVFVVMLLVLVLVHELGHFIVAKRAGCRVEEFAFGFPPRLWSIKRGGTLFTFNLLPIGGYVKIEGEDDQDVNPGPTSFASKSIPWRLTILAAGVAMNIVLAVVLLTWQGLVGVPTLVTDVNYNQVQDRRTFIVGVDEGTPAMEAGLKALDRIVRIDSVIDPTIEQVQQVVKESAGQKVDLEVERQGSHIVIAAVPRVEIAPGEGPLGITLQMTGLEHISWWKAPWYGVTRTASAGWMIGTEFTKVLGRLIAQRGVSEAVAGPIGIAVYTNEMTNLGLSYILEFAAFISMNLAIINILPIPALDGGRILFVILEAIFRRKVPAKIEYISHMTGFGLLIILMILITFRDISRYL
ncbi:MAG: RIP metalloprotease RseP [Candidatus Andersenbacteria bacterium RIFCSPHIGHO2_12_FULL_46_9]|nr:MAG: hypothetical protein UW94_C0004G0013 [Parcubacteria group bacterium GW2011_GWA2_45_14]OGY34791.1 MAG: RIP metalloprotease RseP [Candidatus Andersenbacteria bacterium RIFCSPHIGHO2_02_FULL_46_16]OGY35925.1 MAG: RIP metalloprotease RseP [Candidatus Andersenbacteria bacterium RIFCSPHIGHO2_12_FULL_46_9]OGY38145.1 MAG: RIP metalloprotease RseP [Candidatus Andersenbacteria bacterium RIFCSPLOWO2_02_FULL_46_11]OGY40145.1 MAG: RIP metalloprotease RseP [Candidatus Andersenbacteria bacterium RIFCSP